VWFLRGFVGVWEALPLVLSYCRAAVSGAVFLVSALSCCFAGVLPRCGSCSS